MSDEMAELDRNVAEFPDGWSSICVADALARKRGETILKLQTPEYLDEGALPIVDQGAKFICGYTDDLAAVYPYSLPVIVFGDHTRTLKYVDFPFAVGADGTQCLHPTANFDERFFFYSLQNIDLRSEGYARHFKLLKEQTIACPPLDEQRRIAEVLRSVDEAIVAAEAALRTSEAVHRLLLEALFGTSFAATGGNGDKAATVGQVCDRVTYGFTNPMPTTEEGPWMLTAANVRHGWIDYNSARHTSRAAYSNDISDKSRPPIGAVLVTKDGTLGRVARVDRDDVCINQSVAVLIPNAGTIDGSFLSYLLQCPSGQERMLADSGGSSVKHIYISKLADMPFALPPMGVQKERAALAGESEHAVREHGRAVEGLSSLKAALRSDLLSGRVRVPA